MGGAPPLRRPSPRRSGPGRALLKKEAPLTRSGEKGGGVYRRAQASHEESDVGWPDVEGRVKSGARSPTAGVRGAAIVGNVVLTRLGKIVRGKVEAAANAGKRAAGVPITPADRPII